MPFFMNVHVTIRTQRDGLFPVIIIFKDEDHFTMKESARQFRINFEFVLIDNSHTYVT